MALWLAWDTAAFRGEQAIANGWLQRAHRLLADRPDATEHASLALRSGIFALLDDGDPEEAERLASEAVRIGQALGAVDYEMVGRALHGFARVTAGSVEEGLQELDEVNAAVLAGEMSDRVLIGLACCYLIAACERIRDYERAVQWCDRLKAFCTKWGLRPLFAVCRTQYASVCMWRGAWEEAERELTSAADELAACRPAMTGEGLVRLGELRRRQGKLDEAMALFERGGSHPLASLGRASVIFDRGDFTAAADLAERHLRRLPVKNRTERAAALELMVRACLDQGRTDEATQAVAELHAIASEARTGPLRASASLAAGLVAARLSDPKSARKHLEDAVDLFKESGAPFETGRARAELARVMGALGRPEAAAEEARRAIEDLAPLGASLEIARARAVLDALTTSPAPASPGAERPERPDATRGRDSSADFDWPEQSGDCGAALHQRAHRPPARRQYPHQAQRIVPIGGCGSGRPPRVAVRGPPEGSSPVKTDTIEDRGWPVRAMLSRRRKNDPNR